VEFKINIRNPNVKESLLKIPKRTFEKPVIIEFSFEHKTDIENSYKIINEIVDSLVKLGWLVKDDRNHVLGYSVRFKHDDEFVGNGVKVTVKEY
jgi:rubrerythrin